MVKGGYGYIPNEVAREAKRLIMNGKAKNQAAALRIIHKNHQLGMAMQDVYRGFNLDFIPRRKKRK